MFNKRKTIFIFNQFAISPDMPGGTRHYDFGRELVKKGYYVYIFASDFSYQKLQYMKLKEGEEYSLENVNGVKFVWVKTASYKKNNYKRILNQISFSINAVRVAKALPVKPDIVIGSSPTLFTALFSLNYANKIKADFIAEIRDLWPESLYGLNPKLKYHPYTLVLKIISRFVYRKSKKIVVFTKGNKKYISKFTNAKIMYIPNGVARNMFYNVGSRREIRRKYGFEKFTFVYTGAIGVANGIDTIVEACRLLDNKKIKVEIFGSGPLKDEVISLIDKYNLKNIRINLPVRKEEIPALLFSADAAIITLKNIPLFRFGVSPNKLFEYMYAGLPVLCAIEGEMGDMIRDANCGYVVTPEDPSDLAEKMLKIYSLSQKEREKMGRNGKKYIENRFLRDDLAKELIDLLEE